MGLRTARGAARDLGVAYSTLKRWIRSGTVRTVRTGGGHHRVADAEIDRLLARRHSDAGGRARPVAADMPIDALSARNRLPGFVEEVRIDGLLAQIRLRAAGQLITAVITADAARVLKLRRGDDAVAIVKSTEVMIARPAVPAAPARTPQRSAPARRQSRLRR
jgi:molybdopterin-binding protein